MATPGNLGSSVLASKTKTKKKHFVAQKVKLFRASDPLLSVLMWGVNHSVRARAAARGPFLLFFLLAPLLLLLLLLQLLRGGEPEPGRRPSGCSPSGAARPPRRLCPPSLAHACPSGPLGPPLDLGPESGRRVPSACAPCSRYQCRPPSVRPSVRRSICVRSLGTGKFLRARRAGAVSLGGGGCDQSPGDRSLLLGAAGAARSFAGRQVYLSEAGSVPSLPAGE